MTFGYIKFGTGSYYKFYQQRAIEYVLLHEHTHSIKVAIWSKHLIKGNNVYTTDRKFEAEQSNFRNKLITIVLLVNIFSKYYFWIVYFLSKHN